MHYVSSCALAQVSGIACLGEGVTSLRASSFMGVVPMETWRPQKVWEENRTMQSVQHLLPRHSFSYVWVQDYLLTSLVSRP